MFTIILMRNAKVGENALNMRPRQGKGGQSGGKDNLSPRLGDGGTIGR